VGIPLSYGTRVAGEPTGGYEIHPQRHLCCGMNR
jgi:hypothetical protein